MNNETIKKKSRAFHMQNNGLETSPHTISKNYLKMDSYHMYKSSNHKILMQKRVS
jgi:hypothetical protein